MRKGFRPSLEPPASRKVNLDGRRPLFCVVMTTAVIFLIASVFGVSAWSLRQHRFRQNEFMFQEGDQIALSVVDDDLTTVFCKGYKVILGGQDTATFLRHHAQVNQSLIATSTFSLHHAPAKSYTFLETYLLPGSALEVGACRENGSVSQSIHIIVIKGSSNFNKWTKNTRCSSCILRRVTILPTQICGENKEGNSGKQRDISLNMTFTHTDRYMLVVHYAKDRDSLVKGDNHENTHYLNNKAGVIVSGVFNRTRYDTKDAGVRRCKGEGKCKFSLDWGTDPDVVINFVNPGGKIGEVGQRRSVFTRCEIRTDFWVLLFAGVPVLLGIPTAGVFAWFLCRRSRQPSMKRLSRQAESRVRHDGIVSVRDDKVLVRNEVVQQDGDECMGIQDD